MYIYVCIYPSFKKVYISVLIYIYTYTYMCMCICIYIHTHICVYIYTYVNFIGICYMYIIHTCSYTYSFAHIYAHMYRHIQDTHIFTCIAQGLYRLKMLKKLTMFIHEYVIYPHILARVCVTCANSGGGGGGGTYAATLFSGGGGN